MNIFEEIMDKYKNKKCPICKKKVSLYYFEGHKDYHIACNSYHSIARATCFFVSPNSLQMLFENTLVRIYNNIIDVNNIIDEYNHNKLYSSTLDQSKIELKFPFINKIISEDKIKTLELFQ